MTVVPPTTDYSRIDVRNVNHEIPSSRIVILSAEELDLELPPPNPPRPCCDIRRSKRRNMILVAIAAGGFVASLLNPNAEGGLLAIGLLLSGFSIFCLNHRFPNRAKFTQVAFCIGFIWGSIYLGYAKNTTIPFWSLIPLSVMSVLRCPPSRWTCVRDRAHRLAVPVIPPPQINLQQVVVQPTIAAITTP